MRQGLDIENFLLRGLEQFLDRAPFALVSIAENFAADVDQPAPRGLSDHNADVVFDTLGNGGGIPKFTDVLIPADILGLVCVVQLLGERYQIDWLPAVA